MSAEKVNEAIRNSVVSIYNRFTSEVEATDVVDFLIQYSVIDRNSKEKITKERTKQDRCRTLLSQLFLSSHDGAFIVLREALENKYPAIVECIDEIETNYPKARESSLQTRFSIGADGAVYDLVDDSSFETSTLKKTKESPKKICSNCVELEKKMKVKCEAVERRLQRLETELKETRKEKHELTERGSFLQNSMEHAPAKDDTPETRHNRRHPIVSQPSADNTLYENASQNTKTTAVRSRKLMIATQPFVNSKLYENVNMSTENRQGENPTIYSNDSNLHCSASSGIRSSHPPLPPKLNRPTTVQARKKTPQRYSQM